MTERNQVENSLPLLIKKRFNIKIQIIIPLPSLVEKPTLVLSFKIRIIPTNRHPDFLHIKYHGVKDMSCGTWISR